MSEKSEKNGCYSINYIERERCTGKNERAQSKDFADRKITWMKPRTSSGINLGVTMVNHMHTPHPSDLVEQIVSPVLGGQIEQNESDRKFYQHVRIEETQ